MLTNNREIWPFALDVAVVTIRPMIGVIVLRVVVEADGGGDGWAAASHHARAGVGVLYLWFQ
jgi:hypothetical protein